jgi:hypothetical protein
MIRLTLLSTFAALAVDLFVTRPCPADLFAYLAPQDQILRIDSASGNVTQTYDIPDFLPAGSTTSGMTFDGRVLYLTRHLGSSDFLLQYDVTLDVWNPGPIFLPTFFNPSGQQQPISGLGIVPDEFGVGHLIAVTRNPADAPPSYIFQYQVIPGLPDVILDGINPAGELPPTMDAQGADFDIATNELWVTADEVVGTTHTLRLLHTDVAGNVLQTLSPALGPAGLIRGLAFDNGLMFITGRDLPTQTNLVYEIDRTSGAVVRSFALPGNPTPSALAGGTVFVPVPEPGSLVLGAGAFIGIALRRPRVPGLNT